MFHVTVVSFSNEDLSNDGRKWWSTCPFMFSLPTVDLGGHLV